LEIAWDYLTGFNKWSFNFVIPIMFSASIIALSVFAIIRKLQPGDYLFVLFIISIVSICSLFLIIFHLVSVFYPALICFVFSVISASRIIIFEEKSLVKEIKRRLHL
jgi:CHASE2 domain-containing sensor protein